MTLRLTAPSLTLLLAAALMLGKAQAQSPEAGQNSARTAIPAKVEKAGKSKAGKKKKGAAARKGGSTKFLNGSQETPAQRSARLKRECKDGVNAGACTGYTR